MDLKRVPKIGEILPAFDDGKVRPSRLYETEIIDIIPFEKAKDIKVYGIDQDFTDALGEVIYRDDISLIDAWERDKEEIYWLFADETDYFVRAKVVGDVYEDQWFARTKCGGWFSMEIANYMVGAELDSDMSLFNGWADPDHYHNPTYWKLKDKFKMKD